MKVVRDEILANKLTQVYESPSVNLYISEDQKALVSQTQAPYISIDAFKYSFLECSEIIAQQGIRKFIFDKRSLRAFHQPSMEWYFVVWKQDMFHQWDLRQHRKILPVESWFQKCVEAGRSQIEKKHPNHIFNQLDIRYMASIDEALRV